MNIEPLKSLGAHIDEQLDRLADAAAPNEATRQHLARHIEAGRRTPPPWRNWRVLVPAATAAFVCGLLVSMLMLHEAALTFTVGEPARPGVVGVWQRAEPKRELPLRFSDKTVIAVQSSASAQVLRLEPRGAEVLLSSGRLSVDVVPVEDGDWRFRAGPFEVRVTGTSFDLAWSPEADRFELNLREGQVVVSGCRFGAGKVVTKGERLIASCAPRALDVAGVPNGQLTRDAKTAKANAASAEPAPEAMPTQKAGKVRATPAPAPESWQDLARQGHFTRAYGLASALGFEDECQRASASEILLLGDSARLSGHAERARHAYVTARRRFPGSAGARAAFALGRQAFDDNQHGQAISWFETYLGEQPGGALTAAALDRLLESALRLGDATKTRRIARTYLDRHPNGAHASEARRILDANHSADGP